MTGREALCMSSAEVRGPGYRNLAGICSWPEDPVSSLYL